MTRAMSLSPPGPASRLPILVAPVLFLLVYGVAGFHYETNDDPIMEVIFRGLLFPAAPSREIGFAHLFTASAFGWLYERVPGFPWYGASMCLLSLAAVVNVLSVVDDLIGSRRQLLGRTGILALFFVVFLVDGVVLLNFTRVAILLAGSALLALHRAVARPGGLPRSALGAGLLLFGLALLTRPEAAALSLITAGVFVLLIAQRGERRTLAKCGVALVAMVAVLHAHSVQSPREAHFRAAYPFLVNIRDFGWTRGGKLSAEDSLRLEGINSWLVCDRDTVNVGFLSRVASDRHVTADKLRWDRGIHGLGQLARGLGPGGWLLVLGNGCLLALALLRSRGEGSGRVLRHAAAHALFWAMVCLLAVFMRVIPRVLSPLVALYACASVATLAELGPSFLKTETHRLRAAAGVLLALLGVYAVTSGTREIAVTCGEGERTNERLLRRLNNRLDGSIVILPRPALLAFQYLDPLKGVRLSPRNRYLILGGWPCLLAAFESDSESIAGSARLAELVLALPRTGALILSNDRYNGFLEEYLARLHGVRLSFVPRSPWLSVGVGTKHRLRLYSFRTAIPAMRLGSSEEPRETP